MSIKTLEIRWMFAGKPLGVTRDWFHSLAAVPTQLEERIDKYVPPSDPATNIKLREGRLEIKKRTDRRSYVSALSHAGAIESWSKFVFSSLQPLDSDLDETWIACRKRRQIRWFEMDSGSLFPIETPSTTTFCQVELTELNAQEQYWWSVALEATGPEKDVALGFGIDHLLSAYPPGELTKVHSMGYPEWLLLLARRNPSVRS